MSLVGQEFVLDPTRLGNYRNLTLCRSENVNGKKWPLFLSRLSLSPIEISDTSVLVSGRVLKRVDKCLKC